MVIQRQLVGVAVWPCDPKKVMTGRCFSPVGASEKSLVWEVSSTISVPQQVREELLLLMTFAMTLPQISQ